MRTCTLLLGVALLAQPAFGVALGQKDTFSDGTTMNWGSQASPVNIPTGGPAGAGDQFLQVSREDFPFHIGAQNETQWIGDYLAAGVDALEMDLNWIDGSDPMNVRIMIFGPGGTWASQSTQPVAAGWDHHVFGLTAADLVHVTGSATVPDGTGVLNDTLADVTRVLIRNDYAVPTPPGQHPPHILGKLGIDNIEATPEPASLLLFGLGGLLLKGRRH